MRSSLVWFLVLGCVGGTEAPKEAPKPAGSSCDVAPDKLVGSAWVHLKPSATGDKPNPVTRVRFREEEGIVKADYSASSLSAMYSYSCSLKGKLLDCWEDDSNPKEWCRAWAATHEGTCDPAAIAALPNVNATAEEIEKARAEVEKEFKGLKGEELHQTQLGYNSPNNKIRGHVQVAVDMGKCNLTLVDRYITMVDGKVNEYENQVGTATFIRTKEEYLFEKCEDLSSSNAVVPEGATARMYPAGTYEFEAYLPENMKADGTCTYTADIWKNWLPMSKDLVAAPKDKGMRWSVQVPLAEKGASVVHFDRYKTCNGTKERIGFTCAKLHIE